MLTTPPAPPQTNPGTRSIFLAVVLGAVLGAILIHAVDSQTQGSVWAHVWSGLNSRKTHIDLSQPTVVSRIQQLQRLETVVFTLDKIVSGQREGRILPDFLVGDRLLLVVQGRVVAGIDFAKLQSSDVQVSGREVRVRLPSSEIFVTALDNEKTRVYSRETGLLVPVDPNLESQVRQEATRNLQQSAIDGGILDNARQNARTTLTGLLTALGFEKITLD